MHIGFAAIIVATALSMGGCASIPPEAPELSAQLGSRISSLEAAHVRLLQEFFLEKRRRVDDFVQEAGASKNPYSPTLDKITPF